MPGLPDAEFQALLDDDSKTIEGDIDWSSDEDHSPAVEFFVTVSSAGEYPLVIRGSYNHQIQALTFAMIHRGIGRIYALDLGKDHRNPNGIRVGPKHKHSWIERFRDREAYVPNDITAPATDPLKVWEQFCAEAKITHTGTMHAPPIPEPTLF